MKICIKLNRLDIPCLIRPLVKISSLPIVNTQKPILIPIFRSNAIFSVSQGAMYTWRVENIRRKESQTT